MEKGNFFFDSFASITKQNLVAILAAVIHVIVLPVNADGPVFCAGGDELTPRVDGHAGQGRTPIDVVKAVRFVGQI
jgi:hypothetical protein